MPIYSKIDASGAARIIRIIAVMLGYGFCKFATTLSRVCKIQVRKILRQRPIATGKVMAVNLGNRRTALS
jgi:hypothetical protein